jgi:anti-sigma B factor antagonist
MIQLTEETRDGWRVVAVRGRADAESADELEDALTGAIHSNARVAVDFAALDYISSAGLRAVITAARAAQVRQSGFVVCSPTTRVRKVFEVSGLQEIIQIVEVLPS